VTDINDGFLADLKLASRLGASCPRASFLGTGVPAAGSGAGTPAVAAHSVPRVRGKLSLLVSPPEAVTTAQPWQPINHNYMTRVYAVGEGASGPPTYREPA
jgi:hypothetical protein